MLRSRRLWVLAFSINCLFFGSFASALQVLRMGNGAEPRDLDPQKMVGVYEARIATNLFAPLVALYPKTLEPKPSLATSWTSSEDGLVWTFNLRTDAKWTDGTPIVAQDAVYGWQRLLDPKTASEFAYFGYIAKNGKEFNTRKITDPSQIGIKALGPHKLEVTLDKPIPYFLKLLYHPSLVPVNRNCIEKFKDRWTRPENIVTSGPFQLVEWQMDRIVRLKRNPNYWDSKKIKLDEAHFLPYDNMATEERMFRAGQLDVTNELAPDKLDYWIKDKSGRFRSALLISSAMVVMNVSRAPFTDKRVRKAFSLAIDRERFVKYVLNGLPNPAETYTPFGTGGFKLKPVWPRKANLTLAKKLLKDAGYDGVKKRLPTVEMVYATSEMGKKTCEALQEMWKTGLGVTVNILNQEWKVYLNTMSKGDFQLLRRRWVGDFDDPVTFLELMQTGNGNNNTKFSDKIYDDFVETARHEMDPKKRIISIQKAEDYLGDQGALIPLYFENRNYLVSTKVKNFPENRIEYSPLNDVYLE